MLTTLLKAKLHRARVTHAELDYEGSCALDEELIEAAGLREYEQVQIYNLANGERFTTYLIRGERGSRMVSINGAAAHKASPDDRIIICAYGQYEAEEAARHQPTLVYLDTDNRITSRANAISPQAA